MATNKATMSRMSRHLTGAPPRTPARSLAGPLRPAPLPRGRAVRAVGSLLECSVHNLLERAYAACEALAKSHYENFPVASWLLPAPTRPHVAAVYAYARIADDIADEGALTAQERLTRLNAWQRRLHAAVAADGRSTQPPPDHEDLLVLALAHSIRTLDLPVALFD